MGNIKLDGFAGNTYTMVANRFLDEYMPKANGEFVKIYLYLLRALSSPDMDISICHIADIFEHTEKDVLRALKYWQQAGLIALENENNKLSRITFKPFQTEYIEPVNSSTESKHIDTDNSSNSAVEETTIESKFTDNDSKSKETAVNTTINKPVTNHASKLTVVPVMNTDKKIYTANELDSFRQKNEVVEFLYLAQKYIGKTLSGSDVNTLLYFYDVLGFEPELIEYLIEYCVTNGHKSLRYMEKVAISWAEGGINTVELAKANTSLYSKNCYPVLKAFGLNGRNPGEGEKALIVKWTNSYGFTMDIILDACNRTMNTIHQPSFEYADSILTKWKEKGIHTISDIKTLDAQHQKIKAVQSVSKVNISKSPAAKSKNSFNDFGQRTYNYDTLEQQLLEN